MACIALDPVYVDGLRPAFARVDSEVVVPDNLTVWLRGNSSHVAVLVHGSAGAIPIVTAKRAGGVVIVIMDSPTSAAVAEAVRTGADGVVSIAATSDEIVRATADALHGRTVVTTRWLHELAQGAPIYRPDVTLPQDEAALLQHLANGLSMRDAAEEMGYSERTLYRQRDRLFRRLDATSTAHAVLKGNDLGLLRRTPD